MQTALRFGRRAAITVACVSVAAAAAAEERWLEIRTPHFCVVTDASERDGRAVARGFEQVRQLFLALGGSRVDGLGRVQVDPPEPMVVVATRKASGLRSFVPALWERRGGARPIGVFLSRPGAERRHIALTLEVDSEWRERVVYHEYVHLVATLSFPALPLWLDEGLAEFYADTKAGSHDVTYGSVNRRVLAVVRSRPLLSLARLLVVDRSSREYNDQNLAPVLYAQSAMLMHYFLAAEKAAHRPKLAEYLRLLAQGAPAAEAQAQAFGEMKALEASFLTYVRRGEYSSLRAALDPSSDEATVRTLAAAELAALQGEILVRYGSYTGKEARRLLERARESDPRLALAAQAMGLLEMREGRGQEARRQLADAVRLAPEDFAAHYLWARAMPLSDPGVDLPETEAALRRAIERNPRFAPAHALLAGVRQRLGRLQDAFASLRTASELEPGNVVYWAQRIELLRRLEQPDAADADEARLAQAAPSDANRLQALRAYYEDEKRPEGFERLLRRFVLLNETNALAPMMLGERLCSDGRGDEGEPVLRQALLLQPENEWILNDLAYCNAERGVELDEALRLVERALGRYPNDSALQDTKAWVLFRMGRLEEAERLLRRSLERNEDPDVREHLGDVLERRGRVDAARLEWRRALGSPGVTDERKPKLRVKLGLSERPDP